MSYVMLLWLGLRALSSRSKIAHISSIAAASVSNSMKVREPIVRLYCTSKIVFLDREATIGTSAFIHSLSGAHTVQMQIHVNTHNFTTPQAPQHTKFVHRIRQTGLNPCRRATISPSSALKAGSRSTSGSHWTAAREANVDQWQVAVHSSTRLNASLLLGALTQSQKGGAAIICAFRS